MRPVKGYGLTGRVDNLKIDAHGMPRRAAVPN